jgi:hypothetical protein
MVMGILTQMTKSYKEEVVDQAILGLKQGGLPGAEAFRLFFERIYDCGYHECMRQLDNRQEHYQHILVVAGTYEQFRTYHREKELDRRYRYVSGPEVLRGLSNPTVEFVGTWMDREDIQDIIMLVKTSKR